jgi:hypothetical protein
MKKIILIILFIPILFMPFTFKGTSDFEKRKLFDLNYEHNLIDLRWADISSFFKDHFPFRSEIIKYYGYINYQLGHSIDPNLFIGKEGYLFLSKQNNITHKQRGILNLSDDDIIFLKKSIENIINWGLKNDVEIYFIPPPNQQSIHYDKLPNWHSKLSNQDRFTVFENIFSELGFEKYFINLRSTLISSNTDETPTYFTLEGHWTNYGKMVAANYIFHQLSMKNNNKYIFNYQEVTFPEHLMSEVITNVIVSTKNISSELLFEDNNEKYYLLKNPNNTNGKKLLIWGDSFSMDPFSDFFINNFESVARISSNHQPLDHDFILNNKFNYIFIVITERNFFERDLFGPLSNYLSN